MGNLALFDTAACTNQTSLYEQGDTVYARGAGLGAYSDVYFVWKDPSGAIVRTSNARTVDTAGMAFDNYPSLVSDPLGQWTIELHDKTATGTLLETVPFKLNYKGRITALSATDAAGAGNDAIDASGAVSSGGVVSGGQPRARSTRVRVSLVVSRSPGLMAPNVSCVILPIAPIGVVSVSPVARQATIARKNVRNTATNPMIQDVPKTK